MPDELTACTHAPTRFGHAWLETVDMSAGKAVHLARRAVELLLAEETASLVLSGPVGCGKTHMAAAACNETARPLWLQHRAAEIELDDLAAVPWLPHDDPASVNRMITTRGRITTPMAEAQRAERSAWKRLERLCPRWVNVPGLLGTWKREMGTERRTAEELAAEAMTLGSLVVLDDLGAEKASEWSASVLFEIVNARYEERARTIVTTNLSIRELTAAGYGRIVSRLVDAGSLVEMTSGADYRMRHRVRVSA